MDEVTTKEFKLGKAEELAAINLDDYHLETVDVRLRRYVEDIQQHPDAHNLYEILGVLKFLKLLKKYVFRASKVRKFAKLYESLKFSGMDGRRCYKLTPVQYYQFASMLGFYKWQDVGAADGMPDKERRTWKIEDGRRYELRRLVRDVILFVPRKFSKTTSTASLAVNDLLFGDANGQAYTAANSYKQARICFDEIRKIVKQLDPRGKNFKATRERLDWRPNKYGKESLVECLTGGADTKDGLNASMVIFDEYAQAKYVKDHSEGAELLQVLVSSMGVRREPMTIIITTASRVEDGPFAIELENAKKVLLGEYEDDSQFASLFMPDAWEMSDEYIGQPRVWRKCNPHIGVTVQEDYYETRWRQAQRDAEKMLEFKTKLLNIFVSGGVDVWMPQKLIKSLQTDISWRNVSGRPWAMIGIDLSISDDLSAVAYNIYSPTQKKFYGMCDVYIPEETMMEHPNRELYKIWVRDGWMKVCPGAVISESMIVEDILKRAEVVEIVGIGYDAYKSVEVVNGLRAAIASKGVNPDTILKAVPQSYMAFTSPVESFELAVKRQPPKVAFDLNPIWPYCFGNCYLDENNMGNKKPLKRKENLKIDAAIAYLMTFWLWNNFKQ